MKVGLRSVTRLKIVCMEIFIKCRYTSYFYNKNLDPCFNTSFLEETYHGNDAELVPTALHGRRYLWQWQYFSCWCIRICCQLPARRKVKQKMISSLVLTFLWVNLKRIERWSKIRGEVMYQAVHWMSKWC